MKIFRLAPTIAAISLVVVANSANARAARVALTFDDLPGLTVVSDQTYVDDFNISLLRELRRYHIPAIGFVNEGKIGEPITYRQIANLRRWLDAGMTLGNHTYSHDSPNQVGVAAYLADIRRGEPVIKSLLEKRGLTLRWFRHPYLETGFPAGSKRQIDDWLATNGYRTAPVTIDADDWEFAEPYDDAIARHNRKRQRAIKSQYLAYTTVRIDWSIRSARVLFGRDIAQVMLLHCTRLNADALGDLVQILRRFRLKPARLDEVMRDPAYLTPDRFVSRDGVTWLERWSVSLNKDLPERGDDDPPFNIQKDYDRVDNDRKFSARIGSRK